MLLFSAIIIRIFWSISQKVPQNLGEAERVAYAFMQTGTIADAFADGQGPTAHLMPLFPAFAGLIYRLFGWHSPASDAILAIWSVGIVLLSFMLLFLAFEKLGTPKSARIGALAVVCIFPLAYAFETVWFRVWEGGAAAASSAAFLLLLLKLDDQSERISAWQVAATATVAAMIFFVSPPIGVAAYLGALMLMVRQLPVRRWPGTAVMTLAILVAVLTPWTLRNIEKLNAPVPLRDNFGLELALAYHAAAVDAPDDGTAFVRRFNDIHPARSAGYKKLVAAGGEVNYAKKLGDETKDWIRSNPAAAVKLTVRHVKELFFPPAWYWVSGESRPGAGTVMKMAMHYAISVLGILGLIWGLCVAWRRYSYVAVMTLVPFLPYAIVQPTLRYRYICLSLLVFLSADFVSRMVRSRHARFGPGTAFRRRGARSDAEPQLSTLSPTWPDR